MAAPALSGAQTTSTWLTPSNGDWGDAANWSTDPVAPIGPGYEAVIAATGAPYRVTIAEHISPDRVVIGSPDAEVALRYHTLTASGGVEANAAPLILESGAGVANTRLAGEAGVVASSSSHLALHDVTLATTFSGKSSRSELSGSLTMEGGLILADELNLRLVGDVQLSGPGEIRYTSLYPRYLTIDGSSPQPVLGEGVTLRVTQGAELNVRPTNTLPGIELLTNRGEIVADGGTIVFDSYLSVVNEGSFRAVNGGRLFVNGFRSYRSVGELDIHRDSEVHFSGSYKIGQAIEVPKAADLDLWGNWRVEAPVYVREGAIVGVGGNTDTPGGGHWSWGDSAALEIRSEYVRASTLLSMETAPTTEIRFRYDGELQLSGVEFNTNDAPGRWNLSQAHFTNGVLTGLPNGGVVREASDYVTLETIVLDTPLAVDAGVVSLHTWGEVNEPVAVNGGAFRLDGEWSNAGGITVDGGRLELFSLPDAPTDLGSIVVRSGVVALPAMPADPSSVRFEGGELEIGFNTTLAALRELPTTPTRVTAGYRSTSSSSRVGSIDLEQSVVDVAGQPFEIDLNHGYLRNGTIWKSTDDGPWRVGHGYLVDLVVQTNIESLSLTLQGLTQVQNARLTGDIRAEPGTSFTSSTIDGRLDVRGEATVHESLTVNGDLLLGTSKLSFLGGPATLGGAGVATTHGIRSYPGGGIEAEEGPLTIGADFTFQSRRRGSYITLASGDLTNHGAILADVDDYGSRHQDVVAPSITITVGEGFRRGDFLQHGLLRIEEDYEVEIDGRSIQNTGEIELRGGVLNAGSTPVVHSGTLHGDGAIVALANGGVHSSGSIAVGDHGVRGDDGETVGEDRLGLLQIVGDYQEAETAALQIDLAGADPGLGYDRLVVSGETRLAGALEVSLLEGYDPLAGQTFEILTAAGGLTGAFSEVTLPSLTGGRDWRVDYSATSVVLRALGLPGDYNADGVVTQDDLAAFRQEYGAVGAGLAADGNGDGRVDAADYVVWRNALVESEAAAVPEPSAALLLLACGLGASGTRPAVRRIATR